MVCWRGLCGSFVVLGVAVFGAQAPKSGRGANTREFLGLGRAPEPEAAARGEKLYQPNCGFCHGPKASGGDTGPDLVRSTVVLHDDKSELIGPVVSKGRPERGMPAFPKFTPTELTDIAEFLHMRVELAANRGLYKPVEIVTGNAKAGQEYFVSKCSSCHSATGDLAHIGSKLEPADLQQTFLYPGARGYMPGAPKITKVTVTTASGEAVSGTLKRLDDFHVSLFDAAGNYRSFAIGPGVKVEIEDKLDAHRKLLEQYSDADMHNVTAYLVTLK